MRRAEAVLPRRERKERDSLSWSTRQAKTFAAGVRQWGRSERRREAWIEKEQQVEPAGKLLEALEKSKAILDLPNDWDDAGSPPFKVGTWERMRQLLLVHAGLGWQRSGLMIPVPRILPGPDGSIDLHWKTPRRELLINVPEDSREPITYYGDDFGDDRKKGTIQPGTLHPGLFAWLTVTD